MKRIGIITAIVLALFLAVGYMALGTLAPVPSAHGASRTIMLSGSFATGWNGTNPGPTITLAQGDMIALTLVSSDGAPHIFVIDVAHAGVIGNPNCAVDKCSAQFPPSTTFSFTADMAPGTYTYYCSIHLQHMTGTIVVQSGSNAMPDFSAMSNPTILTINQGSSGSATLTLTSLNSFTGTVALTASISPNGPNVSLSSSSVTLSSNGSGTSTLTVSASSTGLYTTPISAGIYTVRVTETSGSISHVTTVTVNIGSTSSGSSSSMPAYTSSMSNSLLLSAAVVIVVAAAGTVVVLLSRSRRK